MPASSKIAFKEWATVVDALGRGEQVLILRKGGIHEKGKRFDVAHEAFFLFPTFEHQNPADLKPRGQDILKSVLGSKPDPAALPLRYYCVVEESLWVSDPQALGRLDRFHVWSPECVRARYEWGDPKGLFGLIVRTYALSDPLLLENLKRYGGCRSWVELERPISTASLKPVLTDSCFEKCKKDITLSL